MSASESPAELIDRLRREREHRRLSIEHLDRRRRELASRERARDRKATVHFLKKKADAQKEAAARKHYRIDPRIIAIEKHELSLWANPILAKLGFATYDAYIASGFWKRIRLRVLEFYNWTCRDCGRTAHQVHHVRYTPENLAGKTLVGMIALCYGCHLRRHGITKFAHGRRSARREHKD